MNIIYLPRLTWTSISIIKEVNLMVVIVNLPPASMSLALGHENEAQGTSWGNATPSSPRTRTVAQLVRVGWIRLVWVLPSIYIRMDCIIIWIKQLISISLISLPNVLLPSLIPLVPNSRLRPAILPAVVILSRHGFGSVTEHLWNFWIF